MNVLCHRTAGGVLAAALLCFQTPLSGAVAAGHGRIDGSVQRRQVKIPIRDFSLTDQDRQPFSFKALTGKVVLVSFAYTTCPDVCPLMTVAMRRVQEKLSARDRASVYLLTVTTDPEVDTPKVLAAFAQRYGADISNWSFVTGAESSLRQVWKNFGVRVHRRARGLVDHTSLTAVIDKNGVMRVAYHGAAPDPSAMLQDVGSLLAEP